MFSNTLTFEDLFFFARIQVNLLCRRVATYQQPNGLEWDSVRARGAEARMSRKSNGRHMVLRQHWEEKLNICEVSPLPRFPENHKDTCCFPAAICIYIFSVVLPVRLVVDDDLRYSIISWIFLLFFCLVFIFCFTDMSIMSQGTPSFM